MIAFIPIFLTSIGYSELNKADPDCGTTFTWAARAFGPKTGWAGGWAIVAADVLVMASLAQVAGQYVFLLFGADEHRQQRDQRLGAARRPGCGSPSMTYICYRGIEVSAGFQRVLLAVELVMLLVFSVTALIRVGTGNHPAVSITPAWSWFNPMQGGFTGVRQRHHPHAVHLLGLGHRGGGQRGDQGPGQDAGPRRHPVHGHPAGHLRHRDPRRAVVRRHRHQRASGSATATTPATCSPCSAARSSAAPGSGCSSPGC